MSPNVNDSELVARAKAGDHGAFTQIYERYAPAIYRYIYFRIGEAELAEDLQAEVGKLVLIRQADPVPREASKRLTRSTDSSTISARHR